MTELLIVGGVVFLATLTQTLTGFGSALIAMSILPGIISLRIAAPLVALLSICISIALSLVYRRQFQLGAVLRLAIASLPMIPVGIFALRYLPERLLLTVLSLVICSYALYALLQLRLPLLKANGWTYVFGGFSGLLSGAYNIGGPPVVMYAHCRQWEPAAFKSNLASFFLLNSCMVIIGHALQGNFTRDVWYFLPGSLLAFGLGTIVGFGVARYLNAALFQKIVLLLLLVTGIKMLF
jgi:uncharacterized membrane protein YfcA